MSECHRLAHGLDDPGAHDLIGGLRRLPGAACAEIGDGLSQLLQYGQGTPEDTLVAAGHDGKSGIAGAFDAAAHRTVEEPHAESRKMIMHLARRPGAHG